MYRSVRALMQIKVHYGGREPVQKEQCVVSTMIRGFFLGFIKIHVLYHAAHAPVYGLALIDELRHHGYELSPGTLYPLLHQLEAEGYLVHAQHVVGGKVRKYYTTTAAGIEALNEARARIQELVDEVMEDFGPTHAAGKGNSDVAPEDGAES
jgi:PadR family transcriptional regulator, regulatory protein PadR